MCVNTLVLNDQLATCELPYIEDYSSLSYDTTPLYLQLTRMGNRGSASNPIVVTFIASPSASTTTPSVSQVR